MRGQIHIYTGDGKGKTTASMGLAVRFAGRGGKVLIAQFLKDGSSGEIEMMKMLPGVTVHSCPEHFGFCFRMTEEDKRKAYACYTAYLQELIDEAVENEIGLLILDEALGACGNKVLDEELLINFLKNKPEELEVVLTGRNPSEALADCADYLSEICKRKHPFDQGITAREGIEW